MTDEMSGAKLTVRSHDELIAVAAHTLGFKPADSIVCLAFGDAPTARVDLPEPSEDLGEWAQNLADFYRYQFHPRNLVLLAYGEDRERCFRTLGALTGELMASGSAGPKIPIAMWVKGDEWVDVIHNVAGRIDQAKTDRVDAEFVSRGRAMPLTSREDVAAAMYGDTTGVAKHLPEAQERALKTNAGGEWLEAQWFTERLNQFRQDREHLSDDEVAQVLAVLHRSSVRDAALAPMTRKESPVFAEFWHDVVRRAPTEVRDAPLSMLAFSRWLQGRGAEAWIALDQLQEGDPLADLVTTAINHAVDPEGWDQRHKSPLGATVLQEAVLRDVYSQSIRPESTPGLPEPPARRPGEGDSPAPPR